MKFVEQFPLNHAGPISITEHSLTDLVFHS